ncbi:PD-(D/E)XK nuclease family protein [Clostridium botulinum]|uniref:PD-(D/E)XK nuclease family protein n=1 Tax=Clostridium botulinum TaxID=1491 RepID=UPI0013759304|nr:PD-(D/E)XK nuclease family protein [Clostridium botulinum]NCI19693.1 PD-(D/E)XK nuclease family protein [Clostridium botulinum]NCI35731.1 PD-(D/E)XK nuclease family protein [Clostridium botulinum]NCI71588.1 PD-(D/E)XK nuclease family protein [Clostridium botulinum]NDI38780.1 PD-(D/E)XK nuclease family protein [Clostridium botulinum]
MSERKSKEQLNRLKKKYNVNRLWSWSRYNAYKTDAYGYFLRYIKHEPETRTNIYGVSGGVCHDILENLYLKKIKYEDMLQEYENKLFEMNSLELKYDRNDEDKNKTIAKKYEENMRLFFQQHIPVKGKVKIEQFVTIRVGKYMFQGYIDFIHKENDKYIITDFKTSTIYVGAKIQKEAGQLILYAESLIQRGISIENILIRWNFLKYCTTEYQLKGVDKVTKLHKTKAKHSLRTEWVKGIENNLRMWLKTMEYEELEIEDMVQTCIENNNLDILPKELQNKYKTSDCYVYIPLNQEMIDELKDNITDTLDEIISKEKEYKETNDDKLFWTSIDKSNEYYFYCLSGYSRNQHKPFNEYLNDINMFTNGLDKNEYKSKSESNYDMSWLNDL